MGNIHGPGADMSFNELLAVTAEGDKESLILSIIRQAKDGEASAIKLISQVMLENQYNEDERFPISDDRFKEIITLAADRIRGGGEKEGQASI